MIIIAMLVVHNAKKVIIVKVEGPHEEPLSSLTSRACSNW